MKKKLFILASVMIIIVVTLTALTYYLNRKNKTSNTEDDDIRIVTSFYPVYVLTSNLTDQIKGLKVDSLTDFSAGCLHDYQLTTKDMKLLSGADVFIINGGGMEEYLEDVIKNYPDLTVINLSQGIEMLESMEHEGDVNPHVWLDPQLYMVQIENGRQGLEDYIRTSFLTNEKDNKEIIDKLTTNAASYKAKVQEIADEMDQLLYKVKDMSESKNISNKVVVFHDSFAYLANKAGLEVVYTLEIHDDTPLSASEIAEVVDIIKEENIPYLFTEDQHDDTISDRIKEETEAEVYIIDSAVTGNASKDSYLEAMRKNIDTLKKAFEDLM
ncbi:metal ABC transporter substrate-binding protein [Herbinix luporum]|jgi:zinc transport system substrate-binding protein|uniref:metal ABC transporter substrate-binding protein n=1 Tax=Herbinix luporum TaxID=1679721 RepID=UPI001779A156|nr:metal ABC transporter substrate-binding protein [Herbinix luporum]MDI9487982.1 metal ABC transporter substrate-binding protein [Bacillota bacterium]HHT56189.1 zinc ABC transporter substrate-binding protein [Herbinix luporum]